MKKNLLICFSFTLLFFTACGRKDCCVTPKNDKPFLTAEKSGVQWEVSPATATYSQDTINVYGSNYKTNPEEVFGFLLKVSSEGTYNLNGKQAYYYNTVGQDVSVSGYKLDDAFANTVKVTTYDKTAGIIAGTFQIKFIKTYDNPTGTYPDKIAFLNGKFKVALHK